MPSKYLEDEDRVVRYVPWTKLAKDPETDEVLGTIGAAFHLREDEEYLSVTWCDYFDGGPEGDILCAAEAVRNSKLTVAPKGHFAVARKADVAAHMWAGGHRLRFIHEPDHDNPAHVAIRGWSNSDLELLDRLAEEVWSRAYSKREIDAITHNGCATSARGTA